MTDRRTGRFPHSRLGRCSAMALLWAVCLHPGLVSAQEKPVSKEDQHSLHFGVHLPHQRELARALSVAEELLAEDRYAESLPLLIRVLHAPEDAFQQTPGKPDPSGSLRRKAIGMLNALPSQGLQAYRLEVDAKSRRELATSISEGKPGLAGVAWRYPRTQAGRVAQWLLAQHALENGCNEQAIGLFMRLLEDPDLELDQKEQLRVQLAMTLASDGRTDEALSICRHSPVVLKELNKLSDNADAPLATAAQTLQQLAKKLSSSFYEVGLGDSSWLNAGSSSRRNPVSKGQPPHLWARWRSEITDLPTWLAQAKASATHTAGVNVASPVIVDRWLVARTPTGLSAINRTTGKLEWRAIFSAIDNQPTLPRQLLRLKDDPALFEHLLARLQGDPVTNRLSSNGRLVYAISGGPRSVDSARRDLWGGFRSRYARAEPAINRLLAFDTASEGKLAWESSQRTEFEGVFFLDSPLAVGDRLYVTGENEQTIYLFEVEAETGKLIWKQPLAMVQVPIEEDQLRRSAGAVVCYADGLILCSTGAGLVVAVDPIERSLRWVYRFPTEGAARFARNSHWAQRQFRSRQSSASSAKQWSENQMLVSGDRVFVGSPESRSLHCIDLKSGKKQWAVNRGDALLLCYALDDTVAIATKTSMVGLDVQDGEITWNVPLEDLQPAGRGVVFGDQYLQPLVGGVALLLDARTGKRAKRLHAGPVGLLGNLVYDRAAVYSQSYEGITRFELSPTSPPDSPLYTAELASIAGEQERAIQAIIDSYPEAGENLALETMLRDWMLPRVDARTLDQPQLELIENLFINRPAPVGLRLARLEATAGTDDLKQFKRQVKSFCYAGADYGLQSSGGELAVSPSRVFRTVARDLLPPEDRAALRREVARLPGNRRAKLVEDIVGEWLPPVGRTNDVATMDGRWAYRQVTAQVSERPERERVQSRSRRTPVQREMVLPMLPGYPSTVSLYGSGEGQLVGVNAYGEEVFRVTPWASSPERLQAYLRQQAAVATGLGEWIFATTGEDVVALDSSSFNNRVLWSARHCLRRATMASGQPDDRKLAEAIRKASRQELRLVGAVPEGVVVAGDDFLACLAPESGVVHWVRTGLDTAGTPTCDERFVYSTPNVRPGWRVSIGDGQRDSLATAPGETATVVGRMIAVLNRKGKATRLELRDRVLDQAILQRDYQGAVEYAVCGKLLAVVDSQGRLDVLDALAARLLISDEIGPHKDLASVVIERGGGRVFIGVNLQERHTHRASGASPVDRNLLISGPIHCYDLATGTRAWPAPVVVSHKAMLARRPRNCPVLLLAANFRRRDATQRYEEVELLAIDATTGRTLYQGVGPRNSKAKEYRIWWSNGPEPQVTVALDDTFVRLTAIDSPAPPGPPYTAKVEQASESNLWNVGNALGQLFGSSVRPKEPERDDDDD